MQKLLGWAALLWLGSTAARAEAPTAPVPPLVHTEVSAGIGALGIGFGFEGGRFGDLFAAPMLRGQVRFGLLGADADVLLTIPTSGGGAGFGARATARVGFVGERFAIFAGPVFDYGAIAVPALQILPSLRAQVSFGSWGLSAGLFDHNALAVAHLTAELGDYGIGYVAPVGITAHARFWMTPRIALKVQGIAASIGNTHQALLSVGVAFRPAAGGGTP